MSKQAKKGGKAVPANKVDTFYGSGEAKPKLNKIVKSTGGYTDARK